MVGCDLVAIGGKTFREIADDVFLQPAARKPRRDDGVLLSGKLDRFLAADDWNPDFRTRLLNRPRPDRDVLVGPELTGIGEDFLGPGAGDDLVGFLVARAR